MEGSGQRRGEGFAGAVEGDERRRDATGSERAGKLDSGGRKQGRMVESEHGIW